MHDFALSLHVLLNKNYLFSLLNVQASAKSARNRASVNAPLGGVIHKNPGVDLIKLFWCKFTICKLYNFIVMQQILIML
jgi:hypothetical protein